MHDRLHIVALAARMKPQARSPRGRREGRGRRWPGFCSGYRSRRNTRRIAGRGRWRANRTRARCSRGIARRRVIAGRRVGERGPGREAGLSFCGQARAYRIPQTATCGHRNGGRHTTQEYHTVFIPTVEGNLLNIAHVIRLFQEHDGAKVTVRARGRREGFCAR